MTDSHYSAKRRAKRAGQPGTPHHGGISVERLATLFRNAGVIRMHRDMFEAKLGRSLTAVERRAWNMAVDSLRSPDGAKAGSQARQTAQYGIKGVLGIRHATTAKGNRAPRTGREVSADRGAAASVQYDVLWRESLPAVRDGRNRATFEPRFIRPREQTDSERDFASYRKRSRSK